ncbi:hypothetical protein [Escherichia coli]|uniref:zinc finger domain-containing protein n=1 Tax=Escherichia coli TaxID=562 RepID=UPI00307A5B56
MEYVLIAEEHMFVLTTPKPDALTDASTNEQRESSRLWNKSNNMAKCYMMTTMSKGLQLQHQSMVDATEIWSSLESKFGQSDRTVRFHTMREILACKMEEGSSVHEHVSHMTHLMDSLDQLGGGIDGEAKVDIILNTLPKSFENFRVNAIMSKTEFTLSQLLNDLVAAEGVMGKGAHALASTSKGPKFSLQNGKRKRGAKGGRGKANSGSNGNKNVVATGGLKKPKEKGKCFKCGKTGHWKAKCPMLKAQGTPFALVTETCLATCSTHSWVVDTGATDRSDE